MAVPKKKTSKSKRNMRRGHDFINSANVVVDATTGEYKLRHHISLTDGTYRGRQVIVESNDNQAVDETEAETL